MPECWPWSISLFLTTLMKWAFYSCSKYHKRLSPVINLYQKRDGGIMWINPHHIPMRWVFSDHHDLHVVFSPFHSGQKGERGQEDEGQGEIKKPNRSRGGRGGTTPLIGRGWYIYLRMYTAYPDKCCCKDAEGLQLSGVQWPKHSQSQARKPVNQP